MRMEMTSFAELVLNPVAQVKFIHTVAAGYVTGAMFVMGISAYYLLKGRDLEFAKRSFSVGAGFGLAAILSVIILGDESGYELGDVQKTKLAAIEGEWETHEPPAGFNLIGFPDQEAQQTHGAITIPWVMGLIATRSVDEEVIGLKDIMHDNEARIRSGMRAYEYLQRLRKGDTSEANIALFEEYKADLGYGLLLKAFTPNVVDATDEQIQAAVKLSIPPVAPLFWSFRIMVAAGFTLLFIITLAFYYNARRKIDQKRWLLKIILWSIPLPWIAIETGWFVAEFGRQPWAIGEVLPTFLATSSLTVNDLIFSMVGFIGFYTFLLVIEIWLMFHFARKGPSSLHTGRYHFETTTPATEY
jgi:cytochrome d ubiquinol oxidase subunit I